MPLLDSVPPSKHPSSQKNSSYHCSRCGQDFVAAAADACPGCMSKAVRCDGEAFATMTHSQEPSDIFKGSF